MMARQPHWQDPEGLDAIKTIIKKLILNWTSLHSRTAKKLWALRGRLGFVWQEKSRSALNGRSSVWTLSTCATRSGEKSPNTQPFGQTFYLLLLTKSIWSTNGVFLFVLVISRCWKKAIRWRWQEGCDKVRSFWYFSDWFQFLEGSDSSNVAIHWVWGSNEIQMKFVVVENVKKV